MWLIAQESRSGFSVSPSQVVTVWSACQRPRRSMTRPSAMRRWSDGFVRHDSDTRQSDRWKAAASAPDFTLHKTEFAMSVETRANMFWRFAVNIEFNKRKRITLPTIFAGRRATTMPRAKNRKQMDFIVRIFTPDTHRAVIAGKAAGSKRRR